MIRAAFTPTHPLETPSKRVSRLPRDCRGESCPSPETTGDKNHRDSRDSLFCLPPPTHARSHVPALARLLGRGRNPQQKRLMTAKGVSARRRRLDVHVPLDKEAN